MRHEEDIAALRADLVADCPDRKAMIDAMRNDDLLCWQAGRWYVVAQRSIRAGDMATMMDAAVKADVMRRGVERELKIRNARPTEG